MHVDLTDGIAEGLDGLDVDGLLEGLSDGLSDGSAALVICMR